MEAPTCLDDRKHAVYADWLEDQGRQDEAMLRRRLAEWLAGVRNGSSRSRVPLRAELLLPAIGLSSASLAATLAMGNSGREGRLRNEDVIKCAIVAAIKGHFWLTGRAGKGPRGTVSACVAARRSDGTVRVLVRRINMNSALRGILPYDTNLVAHQLTGYGGTNPDRWREWAESERIPGDAGYPSIDDLP